MTRKMWTFNAPLYRLLAVIFGCLLLPYPLYAQEASSLSRPFQLIWQFKTENAVSLTPGADGVSIYLPLAGGTIVSLMAGDGELNWRTEIGGNLSAPPYADEASVYVASENKYPSDSTHAARGALRALSQKSGLTLWVLPLPAPVQGGMVSNGTVLFGGAADGRLYAIKKSTGEVLWVRQNRAPFASQPRLSGKSLLLGDESGSLWAINSETGKTLWRYQTRRAVRAPVALVGADVFTGSQDGYVYAINGSDGRLRWRARTGAAVQSVTPTRRCLVAASLDNFVYCLSLQRGQRIWKRQLAGRISAQPVAADEEILFAPLAGEECVILDQKDGRKVNSIFVGEDNNMAASPLFVGDILLLSTRKGLMAFSSSSTQKANALQR